MSDLWQRIRDLIDDADPDAVAAALAAVPPADRAALLPLLTEHTPAYAEPEPVVVPPAEPARAGSLSVANFLRPGAHLPDGHSPEAARELRLREATLAAEQRYATNPWHLRQRATEAANRRNELRSAGLGLAVLLCVPTAAEAVKLLHRPWSAGRPIAARPEVVPALLRVRGDAWCATLARGMGRRARSRFTPWPFTEALLRATGADLPDTAEAAVQYVRLWRGGPLAQVLAADPWFPQVLRYLLHDARVAAELGSGWVVRDWPPALLELVATGNVDRAPLIAGCLRRLRAGGRPGRLQPYLHLLEELGPGHLAPHRQELVGLLTAPMSTVAGFAYTSLRDLHRTSGLAPAVWAEITTGMLSRPERKLVRAHLTQLRGLPLDDVADGLVTGLHHPVTELAEATLDLIAPRLGTLSPATLALLRAAVPALDSPVATRLAALLGTAAPAAPAVPVLVADLPAALPPALDLGDLAGELTVVLRHGNVDPVRHELILAGLLHAARTTRAAAVLAPLVPQWPGMWQAAISAAAGLPVTFHQPQGVGLTPYVQGRVTELTRQLVTGPPPALLATPATVAGHVDPDRVLGLLRQAERDGWQPGAADLAQAVLRLPRTVSPAVHAAAAGLVSPAGRRFAAALTAAAALSGASSDGAASGGAVSGGGAVLGGAAFGGAAAGGVVAVEPRTWVEEFVRSRWAAAGRIAMLDPAGLPAGLGDPRTAAERANVAWPPAELALWAMVTPSHREIAATHIQPFTAAADRGNPGTGFIGQLAAADGPPGPAMALTTAYALANHRETVRLAAGDALVTLATRPGWDSTGVGQEIGTLAAADRIVLRRTVQPLTEALRAGAHETVWQLTTAALPALLAADPRPGLADLIALAADAAQAGGHTATARAGGPAAARAGGPAVDLPGLKALAARPGTARLTTAARRLAALLTDPT